MTLETTKNKPYQIVEPSAYKRMPWRNGLGETLEIAQGEDHLGQRFRISQAAVVNDGVFSNFQGLHRTLVLLSGAGIVLSHCDSTKNQRQHRLSKLLDIARFAGGDKTDAKLINGPIDDLNIMVREADTLSEVEACFAPSRHHVPSNKRCIFSAFYANQNCDIEMGAAEKIRLRADRFLVLQKDQNFNLTLGSGVFIKVLASVIFKELTIE